MPCSLTQSVSLSHSLLIIFYIYSYKSYNTRPRGKKCSRAQAENRDINTSICLYVQLFCSLLTKLYSRLMNFSPLSLSPLRLSSLAPKMLCVHSTERGDVQSTHRVHHVVPLKHSLDNFFTPQLMGRVYVFLWKCIMYIKTPYLILYLLSEWMNWNFFGFSSSSFFSGPACACLPCSSSLFSPIFERIISSSCVRAPLSLFFRNDRWG